MVLWIYSIPRSAPPANSKVLDIHTHTKLNTLFSSPTCFSLYFVGLLHMGPGFHDTGISIWSYPIIRFSFAGVSLVVGGAYSMCKVGSRASLETSAAAADPFPSSSCTPLELDLQVSTASKALWPMPQVRTIPETRPPTSRSLCRVGHRSISRPPSPFFKS
jgi:hypothetical protein